MCVVMSNYEIYFKLLILTKYKNTKEIGKTNSYSAVISLFRATISQSDVRKVSGDGEPAYLFLLRGI